MGQIERPSGRARLGTQGFPGSANRMSILQGVARRVSEEPATGADLYDLKEHCDAIHDYG
jgi:hypothetical protein